MRTRELVNRIFKTKLVEIFNPNSGETYFYMRTVITIQGYIETYMKVFHPDILQWDYQEVPKETIIPKHLIDSNIER